MTDTKPLLLILLSVLFVACGNKSNTTADDTNWIYQESSGEIFRTYYTVKYKYDRALDKEIEAELKRFDNSLNPFNKNSIIAKVNRNDSVEVDTLFIQVFNRAKEVSATTNGMFDITVAPLINAWGFGFENLDKTDPQTIDSIKEFVGYEKIWLTGNKVEKADDRVILNMSAIAKGYVTDVICNLLDSYGVQNYLCEIGGEITAKGLNPAGQCWRIGIEKPTDDTSGMHHDIQATLQVCDKSVATSGNYRKYYVKGGKKYAHTINPKTGYPSEQNILSATVVANDCMTADAYATAFMTLGKDEAMKLVEKLPGVYCYFIYVKEDGVVDTVYSKGFEQFIVK